MYLRIKKAAIAAFTFSVSGLAFALSPLSSEQTIKSIEIDTRFNPAQVQLYINESISNTESCTNSHRYAFSLNEGGKAMLSASLTAKATGKPIQVNVDGCQDSVPKVVILRAN